MSETGRTGKKLACPHCGESLLVAFDVEVQPISGDDGDQRPKWVRRATPDQIALMDDAKRSGMIAAFSAAHRANAATSVTDDEMGGRFLAFFRQAAPKRVPAFVLEHYRGEFGGFIEAWGADGVIAILSDRNLRAFIPYALSIGRNLQKVTGAFAKVKTVVDESEFRSWVRTRNGYVLAGSMVFGLMRNRCVGEFARLVQ